MPMYSNLPPLPSPVLRRWTVAEVAVASYLGRLFGSEHEFATGANPLARELHARNLTGEAQLHDYHCRCSLCDHSLDRANVFTAQRDCTVAIEVISKPLPFGSDEHFAAYEDLADAVATSGAGVASNAGNHVHVNREDMDAAAEWRLARILARYQEDLDYIARAGDSNVRGYNRRHVTDGRCSCPALGQSEPDRWGWRNNVRHEVRECLWADDAPTTTGDYGPGFFETGTWFRRCARTYEFRLWNATTVAWRMFLHSAMSVALVEAAVHGVVVNADDPRELPEVIGEYLHPDALPLMVRQLRSVA